MKNLSKKLKGRKTLIFLDFEGTQFTHEIIAAGLVKAEIDENYQIVSYDKKGLIVYVKSVGNIGNVVTKLTGITEEFLAENAVSFEEAIDQIVDYVGPTHKNTSFVCFGKNDLLMLQSSIDKSHPANLNKIRHYMNSFFDFMDFIQQYVCQKTGSPYSLVNYCKLFNIPPTGISHNPLNDSYDLLNLYNAFTTSKEIVKEEYKKVLLNNKKIPKPLKDLMEKLLLSGNVSLEDLNNAIDDYIE